jgi:hypothetical protein
MSIVTLTISDHPTDPDMVNIMWDVNDQTGEHSAVKALAAHLVEYLETMQDTKAVTDVEPKE